MDRLLYDEDETPDSDFLHKWREYRERYDERKLERGSIAVELFPPGRLIHLIPDASNPSSNASIRPNDDIQPNSSSAATMCCCAGKPATRTYVSRWANRLDFREIRLSSHIVDDHMPHEVLMALQAEAERFGLKEPFARDR